MPEPKKKSRLPFGMSPVTAIALVVLIIGGVYFLLSGNEAASPVYTPPAGSSPAQQQTTSTPAAGTPDTAATVSASDGTQKNNDEAAVSSEQADLDSFLVSFGRPNPFAPLASPKPAAKPAAQPSSPKPAAAPAAGPGGSLQDRLDQLQQSTGDTSPPPPPKPVFVLTGIVRMMDRAVAVIKEGTKSYIIAPGSPLGETGYVLEEIDQSGVKLVSAEGEEESLLLRRKEP